MFFAKPKKEKPDLQALRPVFEAQKNVLMKKGYPALFGLGNFEKEVESAWNNFAADAPNIEFARFGQVPLLLVANFSDIRQGIESIGGHTELSPELIKKNTENMDAFYVLLDVEDGSKMMARSPKDALKKFGAQKRSPLTISGSIALLTYYPSLLKHHYVISAGSFYDKGDGETLPLLWLLDEHGKPELHYAWFHIAHGSYGTPSFAERF